MVVASAPLMEPRAPPSDDRAVVRPGGDLLEGTPYRIVQPLGMGGMGEVFEAEHRALGHRVVVKVLLDVLAERPDMRDRMRIEAQALARIRHPNLVMVTDFGETRAGHQFIVMERLVGRTLREKLAASGLVGPTAAAEIARQMLLGLHAAHEAGLVHRDVKPENVFLCATEDDRPFAKVLDFGVVKIAEAGRDARTPLPLVVPTREGILLGTPRYFSPEQARQERDLDARSDVYSVGLVLYEMLAGHGPFDTRLTSLARLCQAHANESPEPLGVGGDAGLAALDPIVRRALAKRREDRYADALAFARDLERHLIAQGEGERWFAAPRPVFAGVADPRVLAEAPTSPVLHVKPKAPPPGASATLAAEPPSDRRATSRRLSDAPVMIDHLVERVLASAPARASAPPAAPPAIDDTSPMREPAPDAIDDTSPMREPAPPAPPAIDDTPPMRQPAPPALDTIDDTPMHESAPAHVPPAPVSAPAPAARSSVPDTAPMLDLVSVARAPSPPPASAPPASLPAAHRPFLPLAPPSRSIARATWKTPAVVVLVLVALGLALALVAVVALRARG